MRKLYAVLLLIAYVILAGSCSASESDSIAFFGTGNMKTENGQIVEISNKSYYVSNDGELSDFNTDPFASDNISVLCASGNKAYYQNDRYEIIERNVVTGEEICFFKPKTGGNMSFLGLAETINAASDDNQPAGSIDAMYISDGKGYVVCNNQICELKNGKYEALLDNYIYTLVFDGKNVYFVDISRRLFTCDANGGNLREPLDVWIASGFCVQNGELYYMPLDEYGSIYKYNPDSGEKEFVISGVTSFKVCGDNVYFLNPDRQLLYADMYKKEPVLLIDKTVTEYTVIGGGEKLLVYISDNGAVNPYIYDVSANRINPI